MWTAITTPPTRTSDYQVAWLVPEDESQEEPAFWVQLVACYSTELGLWDGPSHRYEFWDELPTPPCQTSENGG